LFQCFGFHDKIFYDFTELDKEIQDYSRIILASTLFTEKRCVIELDQNVSNFLDEVNILNQKDDD